ncbi:MULTISPECIES: hypothetical protein [unclassified Streptomyces]|uniref:hypothetical protein n=1 Tax=unclassified Streptomyces TaxID=2593676 RepID=UPI0033D74773
MNTDNPTELLLSLAGQAHDTDDTDQLRAMLREAHTAWCEGLGEVRRHVINECQGLIDDAVRQRCADVDEVWEAGMRRSEAVSRLAYAVWQESPAAIAYSELADHASRLGVTLVGEVFE